MAQIVLCGGISIIPYLRPIGIYQLASVLRKHGYTVQVIDSFPWIAYLGLDQVLKVFDKFVDKDTLWIGFGSTWFGRIKEFIDRPIADITAGTYKFSRDSTIRNTLIFDIDEIESLKEFVYKKNPNTKFVMGGGRAIMGRKGLCSPLIDCYIEGYADNTVLEYTRYLEGKNPFLPLKKNPDNSVSITHDHKAISFDYHNFSFTWDNSDLINQEEMLPIEIARGCIFKCGFCSYPLNGRKKLDYLKNPDILREHFINNYERFGTTRYFFLDDTFNDSVEKLEILNNYVFKKLPFKIKFQAYMRLDLINAHRDTIPLLKEMGISAALFGIESLNYEANKTIGKGISLEKILEVGNILKQEWEDVYLDSQYIIGLPNDGEKEINEWMNIILDNSFPIRSSQLYPLALEKHARKLWTSKFEEEPEKFGYSFPDPNDSFFWINNKGLSRDDAIRIRGEFNSKWQNYVKPSSLGVEGRKIIGSNINASNQSKWEHVQLWGNDGDLSARLEFTKNYITKLLNL